MISFAGIYFHIFEFPLLVFLFTSVLFNFFKKPAIIITNRNGLLLVFITLVLYICAILLSIVNAIEPQLVLKSTFKWLEVLALMALVFLYITSNKQFKLIYTILFLSCFIEIIIVLYKIITGDYSLLTFRIFPGYESVFSFVLLLPLLNTGRKPIVIPLLIISFLSIIGAMSRGAFISLILCLFIYFIFLEKNHKKTPFVLVIIIMGLFFITPAASILFKDFSFTFSSQHGSNIERFVLIKFALELFLEYPVFGVGSLNFPYYLFQHGVPTGIISLDYTNLGPHNTFFQVAAEEGLVGLITFLLFLFSIYRLLKKIPHTIKLNQSYIHGLKLFAIVMLVNLILGFITSQFRFFTGIYLGLLLSMYKFPGGDVQLQKSMEA